MKKIIGTAAILFLFVSLSINGLSFAQGISVSEEVKNHIEMLLSGSAKEKIRAARALGKMGSDAVPAVVYLIELLDSSEKHKSLLDHVLNVVTIFWSFGDEVSYESQKALIGIGTPAAGPLSTALLNHTRPAVRRDVAIVLGNIKDAGSIDTLITALHADADWGVRMWAAEALGKMSERWSIDLLGNAIEALTDALKDGDANVRQKASYALGEMKAMQAVPALIEELKAYGKDSDAGLALSMVTGQQLGDDPQQWQEWWAKNKQE
jgi:HEAT repeat protein